MIHVLEFCLWETLCYMTQSRLLASPVSQSWLKRFALSEQELVALLQ